MKKKNGGIMVIEIRRPSLRSSGKIMMCVYKVNHLRPFFMIISLRICSVERYN